MAVELDSLIGSLKASLNAPGSTFISGTDTEWLALLGFAFWQVRRDGFFTEWRLDPDGEQILPVVVGGDDMPREVQQFIVLAASVYALESKLVEADTSFRAKSGEQEFEVSKSAQVLREVLAARRGDLAKLRDELVSNPNAATTVAAIDMIVARTGGYGAQTFLTG